MKKTILIFGLIALMFVMSVNATDYSKNFDVSGDRTFAMYTTDTVTYSNVYWNDYGLPSCNAACTLSYPTTTQLKMTPVGAGTCTCDGVYDINGDTYSLSITVTSAPSGSTIIAIPTVGDYSDGMIYAGAWSTSGTTFFTGDDCGDYARAFLDFNTSLIPDGSTINSVKLQLTTPQPGTGNIVINGLNQSLATFPKTNPGATLMNSMIAGGAGSTVFNSGTTIFTGAANTPRNVTLNSNAVSQLSSQLTSNFLSMGLYFPGDINVECNQNEFYSHNSGTVAYRPVLYVDYTAGSSSTGTIPVYTGFSTAYGTTDFSGISDYTSVAGMTLATATEKVKWNNNVNVSGINLSSLVRTGSRFISINAAQAPSLNTSANVTLNLSGSGVDCSNFKLYYASSFYTSAANIISNGVVVATQSNLNGNCTDSTICQNLACSGGILTFKAMHFDGYAMGPGSTGLGANATLNVSNNVPTIVSVTPSATVTLNAATTKTIYAQFNASDENGAADLNSGTAQITVYKSGETSRTSSGCSLLSSGTTWKTFNCTIDMQFYDGAGVWNVNASISDTAGSQASDAAQTFTVNSLDSILLNQATIDFGSATPLTNNVTGTTEVISNTGNQLYASASLTGYTLVNGANLIDAPNFCGANASNPAMCNYLVNNSAVSIPGITLTKGPAATTSIYHYANIPGGSATGIYNAQSNWIYTLA